MAARSIVLATTNPAKQRQLRWLLEGLPLTPVETPAKAVPETGESFAANAELKALAYAGDGLAVASDGGLDIPAAGDAWNPMLTHRQGPEQLTQLLERVRDRRARWIEAVALADRGKVLRTWKAAGTEGVLRPELMRREGDFWVWEMFWFPQLNKTWAEVTAEEQAMVDHTWQRLKTEVQRYFRT